MGDGRMFTGQQAVDAGLVDGIVSLDQALSLLASAEAMRRSVSPLSVAAHAPPRPTALDAARLLPSTPIASTEPATPSATATHAAPRRLEVTHAPVAAPAMPPTPKPQTGNDNMTTSHTPPRPKLTPAQKAQRALVLQGERAAIGVRITTIEALDEINAQFDDAELEAPAASAEDRADTEAAAHGVRLGRLARLYVDAEVRAGRAEPSAIAAVAYVSAQWAKSDAQLASEIIVAAQNKRRLVTADEALEQVREWRRS
jgi:Spy/CpxP family protein refolding chaperone